MSAIRVIESTGSLGTIQISDGSGDFLSGSLVAGTNVTIANDGSGSFTINAAAGSGGSTIGDAEDGDYTDGLFSDFTATTNVGTAVDRFNEVLKILAPSPAPAVRSISETTADGVTAKLSFGSSFAVAGYTSSATAAGFAAVDRSGSYAVATSGSNIRLGVFSNEQNIAGIINKCGQYTFDTIGRND